MFWAKIWKISELLSGNFQFLVVKFSTYLNRRGFVMAYFCSRLLTGWYGIPCIVDLSVRQGTNIQIAIVRKAPRVTFRNQYQTMNQSVIFTTGIKRWTSLQSAQLISNDEPVAVCTTGIKRWTSLQSAQPVSNDEPVCNLHNRYQTMNQSAICITGIERWTSLRSAQSTHQCSQCFDLYIKRNL